MPTGWTPAAASSTFEEWTRTFRPLAEGSNVVVLEQEIRSVKLGVCPMQLFHFFFDHIMKIS